jgi:uncharacterized protein (DUF433 family)
MTGIVRTDDVLHGQPRLKGTRIGVLHIYDMVVDGDADAASAADALDISLGDVYAALAYYYHNTDEMRSYRRAEASARGDRGDEVLEPPATDGD